MAKTAGYTPTAKSLHWLILALLIGQFIFAWTMPHIGRNTPVTTLISLHFTMGIVILAVAVRAACLAGDARRARAGERPAALADRIGAHRALAALSAAVRAADSRLDQRLLARHADRDVRP